MPIMKHSHWISITAALIVCAASPAAMAKAKQAAKAKDPKLPPSAESAQVFHKYDVDHNGTLNVDEATAMANDYRHNPSDPALKHFDTDHDGILSDQEIMAIPAPKGTPKAKAKSG